MVWPFSRASIPVQEVKQNPVGQAIFVPGGDAWAARKGREFISEGYQTNVLVYRCIREIALAMADLQVEIANDDGNPIDDHPALPLLSRPNPTQGWDAFVTEAATNFELHGEMAIARYPENGPPAELWCINPLWIRVEPGQGGMPMAYVYEQNNRKITFPVDRLTGQSQLFFYKTYNPLDHWRGQSALVAAGLAADTHNAGLKWNYSLLRNSARPSGLIKLDDNSGAEVVQRLKEWFKRAFQGAANAGEIPVLPSGAEWMPMDTSPRDMDFLNTQKEAAKLIASAFGVPLPLIDNDASTFNNMEQAKERFYTDMVIPKFNGFLASFGNWLMPWFGDDLKLQVNMDRIGALEALRTRLFDRMAKAVDTGIITVDEARVAIGYDELGGSAATLDPVGQAVATAIGQTQEDVAKASTMAYGAKGETKDDAMLEVVRAYLEAS